MLHLIFFGISHSPSFLDSAKREKDLPLIQQLEAETTELEDTITEANKNQTSLRQDASTLKEKISDCGET